jgi:hypothetical protein
MQTPKVVAATSIEARRSVRGRTVSILIDKGRILAAAVAIVVSGCTASGLPPLPSASVGGAGSTPTQTQAPSASALPGVAATAALTPTATPTATPTPITTWSKPRSVGSATDCSTVTAGIDVDSRSHIAAGCGGNIVYAVSNRDGSWSWKVFPHLADRLDLDPQIAFQGTIVYLAYTRIAPDGGCGSLGPDVGVFYRRSQPDGSWTAPTRIGDPVDALESFRVAGGTIHAVVRGDDVAPYYETVNGTSTHRYRISGAFGNVSLRVGTDGRAIIAYQTGDGLRYGVFTGAGFSTSAIGGSREDDWAPALALDGNNHAYVVWTRSPSPGGCAGPGPSPEDGTYYATNAGGTWETSRITTNLGRTSVQIDEATGQVHVLVGSTGLRYYTKLPGGPWRGTKVSSDKVLAAVVRLDPATGTLLAVYIRARDTGIAQPWTMSGSGRIYAVTKP